MYFLNLLAANNPFQSMVEPVIALINMAIAPALLLVGALGTIYCIVLGIKLARASDPQSQSKARENLKNAVIGFVLIFVLIVVLKVGMDPLIQWMENQAGLAI